MYIVPLDRIDWVDYPELRLDKHETTEMPFRYVKGQNGEPIMPEVSIAMRSLDWTFRDTDREP